MKTFKLTVTEEELKAIINYHAFNMANRHGPFDTKTSFRIHDLTKRLSKDTPEIEKPEPEEETENKSVAAGQGWG